MAGNPLCFPGRGDSPAGRPKPLASLCWRNEPRAEAGTAVPFKPWEELSLWSCPPKEGVEMCKMQRNFLPPMMLTDARFTLCILLHSWAVSPEWMNVLSCIAGVGVRVADPAIPNFYVLAFFNLGFYMTGRFIF